MIRNAEKLLGWPPLTSVGRTLKLKCAIQSYCVWLMIHKTTPVEPVFYTHSMITLYCFLNSCSSFLRMLLCCHSTIRLQHDSLTPMDLLIVGVEINITWYHLCTYPSVCRHIPLPTGVDWEQKFKRISEMIDGFSGQEIAKLAVAWQVSSIIMVYHILLKVFLC